MNYKNEEIDQHIGQIFTDENKGTVLFLNESTALTVKHCVYSESKSCYLTDVLLVGNDKTKKYFEIEASVDSTFDKERDELVILHLKEKINLDAIPLTAKKIDVNEELRMVGYGNSYSAQKVWLKIYTINLANEHTNNELIIQVEHANTKDYSGFSGSIMLDPQNRIVGIIKLQNIEEEQANALIGISIKNQCDFFKKYSIPVFPEILYDQTEPEDIRNDIAPNTYYRNKQWKSSNDSETENAESETENEKHYEKARNVKEEFIWDIKYTSIDGIAGEPKTQRKERIALTTQWKEEFMQYPGWLVIPADIREKVKTYTNRKDLLYCNVIDLKNDSIYAAELLDFAYEYTNRYQKACLPWDKNMKKDIYNIWSVKKERHISDPERNPKWFTIGLFLLEQYRQNGNEEKWQEIYKELCNSKIDRPDGKDYLNFEDILHDFNNMELEKVALKLALYSLEGKPYDICLRVIGIQVEMGHYEEALKKIDHLIQCIQKERKELSEEASQKRVYLYCILTCTLYVKAYVLQEKDPFEESVRKKCQGIYQEISDYKKYYNLEKEKELFKNGVLIWLKKEIPDPKFDLNRESITLIQSDNQCWETYTVFKSMEYCGFPVPLQHTKLFQNYLEFLIKSIMKDHPKYSWQLLLRFGKADTVHKCLTRQTIESWNRKEMDEFYQYICNAITNNLEEIKKCNFYYDKNIYTSFIVAGFPILEKLSVVLEPLQQEKLISLMVLLINKEVVKDGRLLNPFISCIMRQTNDDVKRKRLNELLSCSLKKRNKDSLTEQLDPFDVFTEYELSKNLYEKSYIGPQFIKNIFQNAQQPDTDRTSILARMGQLFEWKKLSENQEKEFGDLLWKELDSETQLPNMKQYYVFTFMKWPHPAQIDPLTRIKNYFINDHVVETCKNELKGGNLSEISYWKQLEIWNRYYVDCWTKEEKEWFLELFISCSSYLLGYWKNIRYDFQIDLSKWQLKMMICAITSFGRNGWKNIEEKFAQKLLKLLKAFEKDGIYTWEVEAVFLAEETVPKFLEKMLEIMYEMDSNMVYSATMATGRCLETITEERIINKTLLELFKLAKCHKEPGLEDFLILLHNLFYRREKKFSSKVIGNIGTVLRLLENYTNANSRTAEQLDIRERIKIRKQCASLAFLVYLYENKFCKGKHSIEVIDWRNICIGENAEREFVEVKNSWLLPEE